MICDSTDARKMAAAINRYTEALDALRGPPVVGEALLERFREREAADRELRAAFRALTGWTLVHHRGAFGVRR